ncbi:hypothetical protein SAMN04488005_0498 [Yoonia tamlensis]|uniref:Phage regulatory protein CII (CP76) n=1 Tax=Yoonia tamlensis TaxID=390270 RepID=A0A1I6FU37_9RHOB|nr:hypothetical protein [Yoonia tamlensis]SFR33450.1 hypothetical protein SAMN04488005_0498 [Yoonia tamlensis]
MSGYLKRHTESLVKDVGVARAAELAGKSKATLGRYYSDAPEHADRFMPADTIALLEAAARYPHVTSALAELRGMGLSYHADRPNADGSVNHDVIKLSQRFALLMAEYTASIADGTISINEAKRMLRETSALQQVLIEMKLNLEKEAAGGGA